MEGNDWLLTRKGAAPGKGGEKDVVGRGTPPMCGARRRGKQTKNNAISNAHQIGTTGGAPAFNEMRDLTIHSQSGIGTPHVS